jgi:hypothetical protein
VAGDLQELLARCPRLAMLATSRTELGLGAEQEYPVARARHLRMGRDPRSARSVTLCLAAFAQLAFAGGDPERAALLAGAAEGLGRRVGLRAWPMLRRGEVELVAQLRQALGTDRFDQAFAAGARLSQREAVAAAQSRRGAGTRAS